MPELTKSIGPWRGTAMMLNIVLGAGLLTLPGLAVQTAGDAAILVWLVCALAAVPLLVVFAVLGRSFPDAGGLATFARHAFGDAGHVCATFLFLGAVAVGLPAIALTGGHYAAAALGGPSTAYAGLLIVGAMLANLASAETAARVNATLASAIMAILVVIAVAGWIAVEPGPANVTVVPDQLPGMGTLGLAIMMVFFAFTGWEVSANLGGEFRNPKRDFPFAICLSFLVAVALYLVLAVVVAAAGEGAAGEAPFAVIFANEYGALGGQAISLASVLLIFANLSAAIWAVSRMVYSAAGEGLLPQDLSRLAKGVPLRAVSATTAVLLAVVLATAAGLLDLSLLLGAAGQNFLLLYAIAAAALIRLARVPGHIWLGWVCVVLVAGLIWFRGLSGLYYPAALVAWALLLVTLRAPALALAPARQLQVRRVHE
jgi:amino acid efflux transporter